MIAALRYAERLVALALRLNPWLYAAVMLSMVSVIIEIAAMSSLLPLSMLAFDGHVAESNPFVRLLRGVGLEPSFRGLGFVFLALFALRLVTQLSAQAMSAWCGRRLLAQLATRAFGGVVHAVPLAETERRSIGYFMSLAGDEAFRASLIVMAIVQVVATATLAGLYLVAIAWQAPRIATGVVAFLAVTAVVMTGTFRRSRELGNVQIEQSRKASSVFLDALNNLRTVRALRAEGFVTKAYAEGMDRYVRTLFRIDFLNLLSRILPALLLVGIAAIVLAASEAVAGFEAPRVLTLVVLLLRFFPLVGQGVQIALKLVADTKAAQDIVGAIGAMATAPAIAPFPDRIRSIRVRNLRFAHPGSVIDGLAFDAEFHAGRAYALVGPSGSGKSTLFDLLLGLREAQAGTIEINGHALSAADLSGCRARMVLVSQHAVVFNDSVTRNVTFGADVPAAIYQQAVHMAALDDVLATLPEGHETQLAYQGSNLSGGQRQRLGLARGLARNPDVLLLDEPTTGLDRDTRDLVVERILAAYADRIVVWATHDPELIGKFDAVISVIGGGTPAAS